MGQLKDLFRSQGFAISARKWVKEDEIFWQFKRWDRLPARKGKLNRSQGVSSGEPGQRQISIDGVLAGKDEGSPVIPESGSFS